MNLKQRHRALWLAAGLGTLGITAGLGVVLFRHPLRLAEWYARRTLGVAGLRQELLEHRRGQFSYFERRRDRRRSASTVVLIHGLGGHAGNWFKTVRSLRDFDIVVIDLPGHGDCLVEPLDWSSRGVFDIFAHQLDEATDDRPLILVGNSMGGWLSLFYALEFPERVEKLVLVNSAGLYFEVEQEILLPRNREQAQRLVDVVYGHGAPRLPGFLLDALIRRARETPIGHALDGVDTAPFVDDRLHELQVPTEVIWGDEDALLPLSHAYRFHEEIPRSRLHIMVGSGHSPQVSNPKEFNRLLGSVLKDIAAVRQLAG